MLVDVCHGGRSLHQIGMKEGQSLVADDFGRRKLWDKGQADIMHNKLGDSGIQWCDGARTRAIRDSCGTSLQFWLMLYSDSPVSWLR